MSTPRADDGGENGPEDAPRNAPFLRILRAFAALSAGVALYALWSVERVSLDCDLQLAAPSAARPGQTIALRALVFCDLDALAGPRLVTPAVTVALRDEAGRELAADHKPRLLTPTPLQTLDGAWPLPSAAGGSWSLEATAEVDGVPLSVRRPIRVSADAPTEVVVPREAGPLQQYALGRVRRLSAAPAPDRMLPRVVGGACVPERPCKLLLWVGVPAAAIAVRAGANVQIASQPDARERDGLLAWELVVHGPEAELTFEARRDGALVAERALRVPLALGEASLGAGRSAIAHGDDAYDVGYPPGRSALSVDSFIDGRWARTQVVEGGRLSYDQLFPTWPEPGLVRFQARSDRFGSEGVGTRMVYVHRAGLDGAALVRDLARALESSPWRELAEPVWDEQVPAFAAADPEASAAFLLAPLEATRALVPAPSSGRPAQLARLARTKTLMRYGVAGALALSAWLIALSIARRGLLAVDQAQAILSAARAEDGGAEDGHKAARERIEARARVLLMVLAVAAAFLAGALLIAAKSLWF